MGMAESKKQQAPHAKTYYSGPTPPAIHLRPEFVKLLHLLYIIFRKSIRIKGRSNAT